MGFISNLPTLLVAAFRATLEEVVEADLILHVRDISHPETAAQQHDVETVLGKLHTSSGPPLEVWNKVNQLHRHDEARHARRSLRLLSARPPRAWIDCGWPSTPASARERKL